MTYQDAGEILLKQHDVTIKTVRKSMSGVAYIEDRVISCPTPRSAISFAVFAHEVGHIANGKVHPRWLSELKAWQFTLEQFKTFGFPVSRKVRNDMNWCLAYALAKALNRGMKVIPKELKPYHKYLSPVWYLYGNGHQEQKWHADWRKVRK